MHDLLFALSLYAKTERSYFWDRNGFGVSPLICIVHICGIHQVRHVPVEKEVRVPFPVPIYPPYGFENGQYTPDQYNQSRHSKKSHRHKPKQQDNFRVSVTVFLINCINLTKHKLTLVICLRFICRTMKFTTNAY